MKEQIKITNEPEVVKENRRLNNIYETGMQTSMEDDNHTPEKFHLNDARDEYECDV